MGRHLFRVRRPQMAGWVGISGSGGPFRCPRRADSVGIWLGGVCRLPSVRCPSLLSWGLEQRPPCIHLGFQS